MGQISHTVASISMIQSFFTSNDHAKEDRAATKLHAEQTVPTRIV